MFTKNQPEEFSKPVNKGATIIAAGTLLKGDVDCSNDLRIDGRVEGNIKSGSKVVVGAEGSVTGNITSVQADVMGKVRGNLTVTELLSLRGQAHLEGDICTRSLNMEAGVTFNGRCQMGTVQEETQVTAIIAKTETEKLVSVN